MFVVTIPVCADDNSVNRVEPRGPERGANLSSSKPGAAADESANAADVPKNSRPDAIRQIRPDQAVDRELRAE